MRATPSTSPFFACPTAISASVAGCMRIAPLGARDAVGLGLGRHVDHVGLALRRRNA